MAELTYGYVVFFIILFSIYKEITASDQCKDKYKVFIGHTACLPASPKAFPGVVNQIEALSAHNKYRKIAAEKYKANNMLKMIWDDEVAMMAQKWASYCAGGHDRIRFIPGRFTVGQNIAGGNSKLTWETIVQLFYNESIDFHYGTSQNNLGKIGHFTQLTWADSYILGCGYSVCDSYHFYVCNYAPSGNHAGKLGNPFQTSDRPQNELIDCKNTVCEGGSILDPSSCTCKCLKDYYNKSMNFLKTEHDGCKLTCVEHLEEKFFCGGKDYGENSCLTLSNMPFDCPKTCHICPYSDPSYKEGTIPVITIGKSSGVTKAHNTCVLTMLCIYAMLVGVVCFI